ncbi:ABC transporter ATP-binding protein [Actinokineospora globicatena]|uniref:ABC transporter ATP-binding protein n=1 Tax=Actinokineospora globicatena TaxID=103729 RepID=A0A9W6VBB1_9PSEU|nr:ABC transporter ATP-binding protein [Actinokineospora globicatena]MCP2300602.1 oligopeptide transport system ATP-binding protein [Actinokineospora globicatena]GLW81146.1 ABC transporter ATP-binding protein [Actinokineospora globicatena]GLW88339.1 ABC transporter ATP-binding protein [Actinokineospora globicatena]GLW92808.1 ABC transporter ATP-binding protein [Actinokineospora globicatena]
MTTTQSEVDFEEPGQVPGAPLLEVDDLFVEFRTRDGVAKVLNGVSYRVEPGETLAVLGESGSGKSVTAQTIMGILDMPPGFITGGEIRFHGENLLKASARRRREVRGSGIAMIFQDALSALNPVFTVGFQIEEQLRLRRGMSRKDARKRAVELLDQVKIPNAKGRVRQYPHEFSGGMRQRAMIAMSLALDPEMLIADEPTTALDVTVQAQIMDLLKDIQVERNMGLILITHDLGVVAEVADRIAVMYAGRIVEQSLARDLYRKPGHPYTQGLLDSLPRLDLKGTELRTIKGLPPSLLNVPKGCPFNPRCPRVQDICKTEVPPQHRLAPGRLSACHFAEELISGD